MKSKPQMAICVIILSALFFLPTQILAQQDIDVVEVSISRQLEPGTIDGVDIVISNVGDAPLNWSAELADVYGRGPGTSFSKADFANWLLPASQDRISNNVWITRGDNKSIFNAKSETTSDDNSPADTEWALGLLNDATGYETFKNMHGSDPQSLIGNTATLHTISDDDFYELDFTAWSGGNSGGGFAYTRFEMFQYLNFTSSNSGSILPGEQATLSISISAAELASAMYNGSLTINSDDLDEPTIVIPIDLEVLESSTFELSATSFSQTVTTGDEPIIQTLTITNNGVSSLSWSSNETASRPNEMSGVTLGAYAGSVASGESDDIEISFTDDGNNEGSYEWPLILFSNDPEAEEVEVLITLEIIGEPLIDTSVPPSFNTTFVGSTSSGTMVIYNEGTADLEVSSITSSDAQFVPTSSSLNIAPGEEEEITILFTPNTADIIIADLTIASNDAESPSLVIPLSGDAVAAPAMSVSPLAFTESISTSDNVSNTITIDNSGAGELEWTVNINAWVTQTTEVSFTKEDYADESLEANQDRISATVWITRGSSQPLFNYFEETSWSESTSTIEWAPMATNEASPEDYTSLANALDRNIGYNIQSTTMSLHLIDEDRFFDLEFDSWTVNANGGGFSYTRKEVFQWLNVDDETIVEGEINATSAAESTMIDLEIDGSVMYEGDFEGKATITSNDPLESEQVIAFNVSVSGSPDISETALGASISALNGASEVVEIPILNVGDGFLSVSNVATDNAVLVPVETSFTIPPFGTHMLELTFLPQAVQVYDIDLTITSNDPVNPSYVIDVSAEGLVAPTIGFSATSFSATVEAGSSTSQSLTISNNGGGSLEWGVEEIYFEKQNFADFTQAENQDRIYEDVWITRRDFQPIFNYFESTTYNPSSQTIKYGDGETSSLSFSDYTSNFQDATGECGSCLEGNTLSLYLVDYDEYYDLAVDFWQSNGVGGGFSYTRRLASPWLTLDTYSDELGVEGESMVSVTFDATNLSAGNYVFEYEILSNDPLNQATTVTFNLEVTGTPGLSVSEGSDLNFGDQFVDTDGEGLLLIQNTGSATLEITDIQFDNAAFSVSATTGSVEPGEYLEFDLTFTPTLEQLYSATGTITSNDLEGTSTFGVSGNGVAQPDVSIDVSSISAELLSGGLTQKSFTLTNNGSATIEWEIDKIIVPGTEEVFFEKDDYADWTLEENQDRITDDVWITRGDERGLFNAAIETSYTSGPRRRAAEEVTDPFNASPKGTLWASNPTFDLSEESYTTWRSALPDGAESLPGNTLSMWAANSNRYFDIEFLSWTSGNGEGSTNGGGFSYLRRETVDWLIDFSSTGDLIESEDDQEVTFNINAEDLSAGDYEATIIVTDGLNTHEIDVTLTVLGLPEIAVDAQSLSFDAVFVGTELTKEFQITNNGLANLNISSITSDNDAYTIDGTPSALAIGETATIEVTFAPTETISYAGDLTINSNDPISPAVTISLSGSGSNPPELNVDKMSLDQTLFFGASASQTFTISNTGDADLEWQLGVSGGTVEFSKADWADWTIAENQDRITDDIWITRGDSKGLFNAAQEDEFDGDVSPIGTLWGYGATGEVGEGIGECCVDVIERIAIVIGDGEGGGYQEWEDGVGGNPSDDQVYSLYLTNHDLFYDVIFTSWTKGNNDGVPPGGGFSYTRTPVFYEYEGVSFSATEGVIAPGGSQVVTVFFNPTGTFEGRFELDLQVESNDPSGPAEIPLSLNVNGIIVDTPIEDQLINEGFISTTIDISDLFIDAQEDPLTYTVESSDGSVASAVESGGTLTVTEAGIGTTSISITAEDGKGSEDNFEFDFRVNAVPVVSNAIADESFENSFGTSIFDLSGVFTDADVDDELTYSASTSAAGVVEVSVEGANLTLSEEGPGTVNVTVTASDGFGGEVSDVFEVFVNKINQTITFGALSAVGEDVGSIQLNATASSGLAVTYTSSNTAVATVSGSTLNILSDGQTTITASQAGNAEYNAAASVDQSLTVENVLGADALESVEFYPNPVDDILVIRNGKATKIEIHHLDGKLVLSQEVDEKANLSKLEQGVYLIKLMDKNGDEIYSGRLVKK